MGVAIGPGCESDPSHASQRNNTSPELTHKSGPAAVLLNCSNSELSIGPVQTGQKSKKTVVSPTDIGLQRPRQIEIYPVWHNWSKCQKTKITSIIEWNGILSSWLVSKSKPGHWDQLALNGWRWMGGCVGLERSGDWRYLYTSGTIIQETYKCARDNCFNLTL